MDQKEIKHFVEAALFAAGRPLSVDQLKGLFDGRSAPDNSEIRSAIKELNEEYEERGIEIREVASGFRTQVKPSMTDRLQKLWEERPPRYSRALFETLALIAYRQPITRGEIEEVRGVAVSSNIVRTLMERDWVRVVGHRDVPGRPAMFGTTKSFLDYFGLKKLDDLPELADLADWESLRIQLDLPEVEETVAGPGGEAAVAVAEIAVAAAEEAVSEDEPDGADTRAEAENDEPAAAEEQGEARVVEAVAEKPDDTDEGVEPEPETGHIGAAEDDSGARAHDGDVVTELPEPAAADDTPLSEPDSRADKDASAGGS